MQRTPIGSDPWQRQAWTPGSWGVNDSGSAFSEFPGPTPGPWGVNDGSPGCILGMSHTVTLTAPESTSEPEPIPDQD